MSETTATGGGRTWEDPRVRAGTAEQLAQRQRQLANGASRLGWKLAFGTEAAAARWGISGPAVGFLTDATSLAPGTSRSLAGMTSPVLEAEVAVLVAAEGDEVRLDRVGLAFELADIGDGSEDLAAVVAGDIYHRAVVLGPLTADPGAVGSVRIERDGEEVGVGADPAAATGGSVAELTGYTARYLAAFGEELAGGDVLITGSVVPPMPCSEGGRFQLDGGSLGTLELELLP